ncbi:MAG: helix-turn-helix transcriptional regulator [Dyella sp.]|uniref:helix-turn-helix transcriptional regulator n=1 Tax=Dyella sp. TaxID=1869338 RepID=UPI003F7ED3D8
MNALNETGPRLPAIIRRPELLEAIGLSRPTVYRMMKAGTFPQQVRLGAAAVGWLRAEVEQWIAERARARATSMPEQGLESEQAAA